METTAGKLKKSKAGANGGAAAGQPGDATVSSGAPSTTAGDLGSLDVAPAKGGGGGGNNAGANVKIENISIIEGLLDEEGNQPEILNKKALDITQRVRDKLTGRDFSHDETLDVKEQVDRLILQATNNENLCQSYIGWCPFW